jgi:hypothetical protein
MFFLLRMAFWLGVVCVLLPSGGAATNANVDTAAAVSAATAAASDMAGFCDRQPNACVVGGQVAVAIGQKAEAGARALYEMFSAKMAEKANEKTNVADTTASTTPRKAIPVAIRGTLTSSDLALGWHAPVPLPPRREARAGKPSV